MLLGCAIGGARVGWRWQQPGDSSRALQQQHPHRYSSAVQAGAQGPSQQSSLSCWGRCESQAQQSWRTHTGRAHSSGCGQRSTSPVYDRYCRVDRNAMRASIGPTGLNGGQALPAAGTAGERIASKGKRWGVAAHFSSIRLCTADLDCFSPAPRSSPGTLTQCSLGPLALAAAAMQSCNLNTRGAPGAQQQGE